MLELKDFIAQSLSDIFDGLEEAKIRVGEKGIIAPYGSSSYNSGLCQQNIAFDIAIQVSTSDSNSSGSSREGSAGGKILVASAKAQIGDQKSKSSDNSKETISRIKFDIPVGISSRIFKKEDAS